jgi:hypothetical protein
LFRRFLQCDFKLYFYAEYFMLNFQEKLAYTTGLYFLLSFSVGRRRGGGGQVSLFTLPAHRKAKLVLSGKPNHSTLHLFYHWFYSPVKTVLLICRIETESSSIAKCLTNKSLHFKRYRKGVSNCDKLVLTKCVKMSVF